MLKKKTQGFTLIELLIVIAIIGILAAVLIPNLLSARNRANDTAAQAYLREAVTFQEIHQIDNNVYAGTEKELTDLGMKAPEATITFAPVAASATGYCMTATHTGGSNKVFWATSSEGLNDSTPACTAAK